ncbi:MAG TPA: hypothetical protein VIT43_12875 [Candidatus Dormibacteraeota bacterium]
MSFRPDSPLNRLVILWPGVPIAACSLGFILAVVEISETHSGAFAALAIAMGCGLAFSLGLLFHSFFIEWTEVIISREGIALRPVGHAWLNRAPRVVPWDRVKGMNQVMTREGGHLEIAAGSRVHRLDRAMFRADTFANLCAAVAQRTRQWSVSGFDEELLAA